jgi:hypothetical protein
MLADDLIAFVRDPKSKDVFPDKLLRGYRKVADKVEKAPRFILDRDAVLMVHQIGEMEPSKFLSAIGICRLPFPVMWVEFAFADRQIWLDDAARRGIKVEKHDHSSAPARLGFLFEQQDDEGRIMTILPVWKHANHETISVCNLCMRIDARPDVHAPELSEENEIRSAIQAGDEGGWHKWKRNPREMVAAVALENRFSVECPEALTEIWEVFAADVDQSAFRSLMSMARFDLASEWRFALTLLTVMNSRNVIEVGPETDLTKLNKGRIKKGVPPLLSHREVRLSLSKGIKRRLTKGGAGTGDDREAHLVMGHWKLRSTGLYWWSPHVRGGSADEGKPRIYRVGA